MIGGGDEEAIVLASASIFVRAPEPIARAVTLSERLARVLPQRLVYYIQFVSMLGQTGGIIPDQNRHFAEDYGTNTRCCARERTGPRT